MAKKEAETGYLVSLTYNEMRALQDVTDRLAQHARLLRCSRTTRRSSQPTTRSWRNERRSK
jgi:hypothetical protein